MPKKRNITKEEIEKYLTYIPEKGAFLWKIHNKYLKPGSEAGRKTPSGISIGLHRISYGRKYLVWTMEKRAYPDSFILNVNGDIWDDRIENLIRLPAKGELLTKELADTLFEYEPISGQFKRKTKFVNGESGVITSVSGGGYLQTGVGAKSYPVHRLIWLMIHGWWPENIDHINGVRTDNRLINLRAATKADNARNAARTKSQTGVTGVYKNSYGAPYRSRIRDENGKQKHLGNFSTLEEAKAARKAAEAEKGYHPNHGETAQVRAKYPLIDD